MFVRRQKRLDVVERADEGPVLRDRHRASELACRFCGRRSIFCIWVRVCVAGAAICMCLKGLDVVERAAGAPFCATGAALWRLLADFMAGAAFSAYGCVCVWAAGAAFGMCLMGLFFFERAAGAPFCVTGAALWRSLADFMAGTAFFASGCVFAWQGQHLACV